MQKFSFHWNFRFFFFTQNFIYNNIYYTQEVSEQTI